MWRRRSPLWMLSYLLSIFVCDDKNLLFSFWDPTTWKCICHIAVCHKVLSPNTFWKLTDKFSIHYFALTLLVSIKKHKNWRITTFDFSRFAHGRLWELRSTRQLALDITLLILTLYCLKLWHYSDNRKSKGPVNIMCLTEIEQLQISCR